MSYAEYHLTAVTTATSGVGTAYTPVVTGRVYTIFYAPGTLATGADITITGETTTQPVVTLTNPAGSAVIAPRQATHNTSGAAALYATGGAAVLDYIYIVKERIKIAVAQGGNANTGAVGIIVG